MGIIIIIEKDNPEANIFSIVAKTVETLIVTNQEEKIVPMLTAVTELMQIMGTTYENIIEEISKYEVFIKLV
jgi:hypothetical protein